MPNFEENLKLDLGSFKERIYNDRHGILDPPSLHHEFVSGNHGRKLDFDKIPTGSDLYIQWTALFARVIKAIYKGGEPNTLVGIANGANRLPRSLAPLLGEGVLALTTEKEGSGSVKLDSISTALADEDVRNQDLVLIIDDVGSTGGTAASVVSSLRKVGFSRIEAMYFWQRSPNLPAFDDLGISYKAVITEELPMFAPDECLAEPEGYCHQGVSLALHG